MQADDINQMGGTKLSLSRRVDAVEHRLYVEHKRLNVDGVADVQGQGGRVQGQIECTRDELCG